MLVGISLAIVPKWHSESSTAPRVAYGTSLKKIEQFLHRPIYAHSVVPGGIYTPEEFTQRRNTDSQLAEHYGPLGVQVSGARLAKARLMYVSYRSGGKIYWTRHRLRIPKGEAVLSDGIHLIRQRCGNRLSDVPRQPVLQGDEPPQQTFDTVEAPPIDPLEPELDLVRAMPDLASSRVDQVDANLSRQLVISDEPPVIPEFTSFQTPVPTFGMGYPGGSAGGISPVVLPGSGVIPPISAQPTHVAPEPRTCAAFGWAVTVIVWMIHRKLQHWRKILSAPAQSKDAQNATLRSLPVAQPDYRLHDVPGFSSVSCEP